MFKKINYAITLLLLFIGVGGFILPNTYQVQRSIEIAAEPDEIHIYVGNLRRWHKWVGWQAQMPDIQIHVQKEEGVGASKRWNSTAGKGSITLIRSEPYYGIDYDLIIDDTPPARAGIHYSLNQDKNTIVTWTINGQVDSFIFGPYIALMMNAALGDNLVSALTKLKDILENSRL